MSKTLKLVLLGFIAVAAATALYLYKTGYYATWTDRQEELTTTFATIFVSLGASEKEANGVAPCAAKEAITVATDSGCKLDADKKALDLLKECANNDPGFGLAISMAILKCAQGEQ